MSNLNLQSSGWIDLVFEGRNQSYGAYRLRRENDRTTLMSFLGGMLLLGLVLSVFASVGSNSIPMPTETLIEDPGAVVTLTEIHPPNPKLPKSVEVPIGKMQPPAVLKTQMNLAHAVVSKPDSDVVEITTDNFSTQNLTGNEDGTVLNSIVNTASGTGNSEGTASTGNASGEDTNTTYATHALDVMPMFPGGMNKFYEKVRDNFRSPVLDTQEQTYRILVAFVIEPDGSMSHIRALNNPGHGIDVEAVRTLKSIRVKWQPGKVKGQSVRTSYQLPIVVRL